LPVMLVLSGIGLYSCSGWTWKRVYYHRVYLESVCFLN